MNSPTTRILLFGALEISHTGAEMRRPPTQRVLALLGFLIAHADIPQPREKLVDALWPDLLPHQGRRMLSDTLWRARKLLTPPGQASTSLLVCSNDTLRFHHDRHTWVDVLAFAQQLRLAETQGDYAGLRHAVSLYRGDFLEECYDDWALYERERLREQYLSALQRLLEYDQARGAHDAALQSALRLVQADPLREDARRELMRLYHLLGRTSEALKVYEQGRAVLATELGVEPEPESESLYEELRALHTRREAQEGAVGGAAHAGPVTMIGREVALVGRQAARGELLAAVEGAVAGRGGIVLVAGEAGQGKSRLLEEVARGADWRGAQISWGRGREDAQALPLGVLREALSAALTPMRARQVANLISAQSLNVLALLLPQLAELLPDLPLLASHQSDYQVESFHAALAQVLVGLGQIAPQVLLLEDLHWFDRATLEALAAVLPALPHARVLLILSVRSDELSRHRAVWDSLLRFDRSGLLKRVELSGLSLAEVTDLVRRALQMKAPAPRFSARLFEATSGNPFFVLETLRALYEQGTLTRDEQGIWHTPWDEPEADYHELPLPAGLRQAIDGRLQELASPERAALAAAAVLGHSFTPATLARVADSEMPPTLLRRQFLVEDNAGYRFGHDTLREVIYSGLDNHTRQSLHLRAAEALEQEHYARVEALAQHFYLAGAWDKAIPYLVQAGDHARALCAYRDALHCYEQGIEAAQHLAVNGGQAGERSIPNLYLKSGELYALLGDYTGAVRAYERVLALADADTTGARRSMQIQALNGLGYVHGLTNDFARAREISQRAIVLAAESPRLHDQAATYFQAGSISYHMNDYDQAISHLQQALELYQAVDSQDGQARCLELLAWTWRRQEGVTDRVVASLQQALAIYRTLGDEYRERHCLVSLANVYVLRGTFDQVLDSCDTVLPFFRAVDARYTISECQYLRGVALYSIGRFPAALDALSEALLICQELGITAAVQLILLYRGQVLRALGRYEEGLHELAAARAATDRLVRPQTLCALTELWLDRGELKLAFRTITEALSLVREVGSQPYLGVALRVLGQVRAADRDQRLPPPSEHTPDADTCFKISSQLLETAHYDSELGLTYTHYGRHLLESHRISEANDMLLRAQALAQRCGMLTLQEAIQPLLQRARATSTLVAPGQIRVRLACRGTPRGRPLRPDELAEVFWTIESAEDQAARLQGGKVAERQIRIRRLCAEAIAQGAEPTVEDLAAALGVAARTVDRDIAALRAAGAQVVTRGAAGT